MPWPVVLSVAAAVLAVCPVASMRARGSRALLRRQNVLFDAAQLKAEPRGVTVTFYSGAKAPCPCIADGVMIATQASPGQGTLQVAAEKAPAGMLAVVVVRDRKSGAGLRYTVKDEWMARIAEWNCNLDPAGRYQAAMAADGLFEAAPLP